MKSEKHTLGCGHVQFRFYPFADRDMADGNPRRWSSYVSASQDLDYCSGSVVWEPAKVSWFIGGDGSPECATMVAKAMLAAARKARHLNKRVGRSAEREWNRAMNRPNKRTQTPQAAQHMQQDAD